MPILFFFFLILIVWKILFIFKREKAQAGGRAEGEEEKASQTDSWLSKEPDVGLDLTTLRP